MNHELGIKNKNVTHNSLFIIHNSRGFSLVEVLLAVSLFGLIVTALVGGLIYGQQSTAMAGMRARAVVLADEGLEVARNIRDENYANLTDGTFGLAISGNQWNFSGASDATDIFTRTVAISPVSTNKKLVTSTVSWQQNQQRVGQIQVVTYLTNWRASVMAPATCNEYAVGQGYSSGTCRQNTQQCTNNGETYLSGGDVFCTGGPNADTCCAFTGPAPTPTPTSGPTPTPASTCAGYCQSLGTYSTGTCRKGVPQCNANGETNEHGGNPLCTQAEGGTCCCAP